MLRAVFVCTFLVYSFSHDVAFVNLAKSHLEILSGFLHVLSPVVPNITAYISEKTFKTQHGFFDWIGEHMEYSTNSVEMEKSVNFRVVPGLDKFPHHDTLFFVTPEYTPDHASSILRSSSPRQVVLLVHEAHTGAIFKLQECIRDFHGVVRYIALAPHVANAVTHMNAVNCDWAFPVMPSGYRDCCQDYTCSGFSLQGRFESGRRYELLWDDIKRNFNLMQRNQRMRLKLIGRGDVSALNISATAAGFVEVAVDMPYPKFYKYIQDSIGVIPLLTNQSYFQVPSSLISSYVTATPMIVNDRSYHAYKSFLACGYVPCYFHHLPFETVVEAMTRIVEGGLYYACHVRRALVDHRRRLNQHAQHLLMTYLQ